MRYHCIPYIIHYLDYFTLQCIDTFPVTQNLNISEFSLDHPPWVDADDVITQITFSRFQKWCNIALVHWKRNGLCGQFKENNNPLSFFEIVKCSSRCYGDSVGSLTPPGHRFETFLCLWVFEVYSPKTHRQIGIFKLPLTRDSVFVTCHWLTPASSWPCTRFAVWNMERWKMFRGKNYRIYRLFHPSAYLGLGRAIPGRGYIGQ